MPQDVSIISQGYDPKFDLLHPDITRIEYDLDKMVSACVLWLRGVAQGKPSQRKSFVQAKLIEGGTIGPVPRQ